MQREFVKQAQQNCAGLVWIGHSGWPAQPQM